MFSLQPPRHIPTLPWSCDTASVMSAVFAGSEMSPLIPSRPDIRKCSRQDRVVPVTAQFVPTG